MAIIVRRTETLRDYAACVVIRYRVFVLSQNVPEDLEIDGHEDTSVHYLALDEGAPVGTARYRVVGGRIPERSNGWRCCRNIKEAASGRRWSRRVVDDLKALGPSPSSRPAPRPTPFRFMSASASRRRGRNTWTPASPPRYLYEGVRSNRRGAPLPRRPG